MIRWVIVIFVALTVFYPLLPWILEKVKVGLLPGDVRFRVGKLVCCLPLGSTLIWSAVFFAAAKLFALW